MAPHFLLALAVAAVWLPRLPSLGGVRIAPWAIVFVAAFSLAIYAGIVTPIGVLSIGCLVALLGGDAQALGTTRVVFRTASIVMLIGFAIQLVPGFVGTTVVNSVQLSADASPMHLTARFDVGLAALFLVALYCRRATSFTALRALVMPTVVVAIVTTTAVMSTAWMAGYIRFDPKWPPFALVHLGKTLLVTAVVEEAIFRGVLQDRLARLPFFSSGWRAALPVVFSATLFGLAHLPGGWLLAAMATLAGLGYALAYGFTKTIEAPIAVHFLVNATHFIAFTYPHLSVT